MTTKLAASDFLTDLSLSLRKAVSPTLPQKQPSLVKKSRVQIKGKATTKDKENKAVSKPFVYSSTHASSPKKSPLTQVLSQKQQKSSNQNCRVLKRQSINFNKLRNSISKPTEGCL